MRQVIASVLVLGLVFLLGALLAPVAGATPKTGFEFGRLGGNIRPFTLTVATTGKVTATGAAPAHASTVTKPQLANLNRIAFETDFARLPAVIACPRTLPDVAAQFIRVGARTVRVHGSCSHRFNRLWTALGKTTAG